MKLSVLQENLVAALRRVAKFSSTTSHLSVLQGIKLVVDKGGVWLSAFDLKLGIKLWLPAKVSATGEAIVPAKPWLDLVSSLRPGQLQLRQVDKQLLIKTGSTQSKLNLLSGDEFPQFPKLKDETLLKLDQSQLSKIVQKVVFAASSDDLRPVLTGVKLEVVSDKFKLVATDGYRLSILGGKIKPVKQNLDHIIPAQSFKEVEQLIDKDQSVQLRATGQKGQLAWKLPDDIVIYVRLLEGEFPNYQQISKGKADKVASLDKDELIHNLKTSQVFARDNNQLVKLEFGKDGLQLQAESNRLGKNIVKQEVKTEQSKTAAFNCKFLLDFLQAADGNEVSFSSQADLSPGLWRDEDQDFLHVIMPVRLADES